MPLDNIPQKALERWSNRFRQRPTKQRIDRTAKTSNVFLYAVKYKHYQRISVSMTSNGFRGMRQDLNPDIKSRGKRLSAGETTVMWSYPSSTGLIQSGDLKWELFTAFDTGWYFRPLYGLIRDDACTREHKTFLLFTQ